MIFQIYNRSIKLRQVKIIPKKSDLFVSSWKRNNKNKIESFDVDNDFDFCMIATGQYHPFSFFFFAKYILSEMQILTASNKKKSTFSEYMPIEIYSGINEPEKQKPGKQITLLI